MTRSAARRAAAYTANASAAIPEPPTLTPQKTIPSSLQTPRAQQSSLREAFLLESVDGEKDDDDEDTFIEDKSTPATEFPIPVRVPTLYIAVENQDIDEAGKLALFSLGVVTYSYIDTNTQEEMFYICLQNKSVLTLQSDLVQKILREEDGDTNLFLSLQTKMAILTPAHLHAKVQPQTAVPEVPPSTDARMTKRMAGTTRVCRSHPHIVGVNLSSLKKGRNSEKDRTPGSTSSAPDQQRWNNDVHRSVESSRKAGHQRQVPDQQGRPYWLRGRCSRRTSATKQQERP